MPGYRFRAAQPSAGAPAWTGDALIDRVAIVIDFVLGASDALRHRLGGFVGQEAIHHGVGVRDEVEAVNGQLLEPVDGAVKVYDVFLRR
jgi:hypothetical protein